MGFACTPTSTVVIVDARGAQFSEGKVFFWGDQEAEDIYGSFDTYHRAGPVKRRMLTLDGIRCISAARMMTCIASLTGTTRAL